MKKVLQCLLFSSLLLLPLCVAAQDSVKLSLISHWQADTGSLPRAYNDIWGWTSPDNREYAIIGSLDSIYFIEVTDPKTPVLRDVEAGKFYVCTHRDFKTYKNYCYAVADEGNSSLQIFDMKYLPDSVHKVYDSDTLTTRAHNIFIEGDRLYFAAHRVFIPGKNETKSLAVASLANPEIPEIIAYIDGSKEFPDFYLTHDVYVKNDTAYCSNETAGLYIYDMRNPTNPALLGLISPPYPYNGYNHSGWLAPDNKTFVFADETHGSPLKVYDVSGIKKGNNGGPKYLNIFGVKHDEGSVPHNPFVKGNYVYVSYYHEGLVVFDISDPKKIKLAAQYDTYPQNDSLTSDKHAGYQGCWGVYPFFPSGTIVASDISNGLFVFKLDTVNLHYIPRPDPIDTGAIPSCNYGHLSVYTKSNADEFKIFYKTNDSSVYRITLTDMAGKVVWSKLENGVRRETYTYSPSQPLSRGVYIITVEVPNQILLSCKFIRQ